MKKAMSTNCEYENIISFFSFCIEYFYHEAGEHEELRGSVVKCAGLRHSDDDEVAEGGGEKPEGLHNGLHAVGRLAVGELYAGDAEHDLPGGDDDDLG